MSVLTVDDRDRPVWRCSVCGDEGTAWTPRLAYLALADHYARCHA